MVLGPCSSSISLNELKIMAQQPIRRRDNSSTETCGYMTFILSNAFFVIYFLWALLPDHIMEHIDEHYTTYYPPRELAGYIPAYLSLLFVFAPILYMGLNMVTCPKVDDIDGIWDTRSNMCVESSACNNDTSREDLLRESTQECGNHNTSNEIDSLPAICDEDVRLVNARIRQQLMKKDCDG